MINDQWSMINERREIMNQTQGNIENLDLIPNSKFRTPNCRIITTPEQIVREFRVGSRGVRIEYVKEPISRLERAIWIFLLITIGWMIGYLHHFLTTLR